MKSLNSRPTCDELGTIGGTSINCHQNPSRCIPSDLYNSLVHYFKYASCSYILICPRPNGSTLVLQFSNIVTDIQGYVARDPKRKEIVVALRGSLSAIDFLLDAQIVLVPYMIPGVSVPAGTKVHSGFLIAWDSVVLQVMTIVSALVTAHPDYSIVTTGHSLGGALSTLAAVSLKGRFPGHEVRTYSYGSPRIGNRIFAEYVNQEFGTKAFRGEYISIPTASDDLNLLENEVVHGNDGVPTILPTSLGYHHHGIEYWQSAEPSGPGTTRQCSADGEDPSCSASIPSRGFTPAHLTYFGIPATMPFCL